MERRAESKITEVLLAFETGKINKRLFVDFCWGLHHNGGQYFNKVWHYQLEEPLNANLQGDSYALLNFASKETRNFYKEVKSEKT